MELDVVTRDLSYPGWTNWLLRQESEKIREYHIKVRALLAMSKHIKLMPLYGLLLNKDFDTFERLHSGQSV